MDKDFAERGFFLAKGFFNPDEVTKIHTEAKLIFFHQMKHFGIVSDPDIVTDEGGFSNCLYRLFKHSEQAFINSGKQIQHLIKLHRLSVSERVTQQLLKIGLEFPNVSTRPVMYFNSPKLAKERIYHTVFAHQDWRSMQGSLDSVILWLPLVDIDKKLGALEIIPGSHKWGLVTDAFDSGFGKVDLSNEKNKLFEAVEVKKGDALFFSSFLVHQSGTNTSGKIRWSAHFRYNNLEDPTFIERNYAHPYIYKPREDLITPNFPSQDDINKTFNNEPAIE